MNGYWVLNLRFILLLLCLDCGGFSTHAQGVLAFGNRTQAGDVPVYWPDGSAPGSRATAGLYLVEGHQLTLVSTSPFRDNPRTAHYFGNETVVLPGYPDRSFATFRVRVWETSAGSFENAISIGAVHGEFPTVHGNNELTVQLGDGRNFVPTLIGLLPFTLVPEPSAISIFVAGGILVLVGRRCSR